MTWNRFQLITCAAIVVGSLTSACSPTVKVEAPKEPITINLNIKLDAKVLLQLEEKAKNDIQKNSEIF